MKCIYVVIIVFFTSCKSTGWSSNGSCDENLKFKEVFFAHIKSIEDNIAVSQDSIFRKSVIFISNHAPVSVNSIANYATTYPIGVFEEDRIKWIAWYEENKCKNIQFKTVYVIPDVYKD